MPPIPGITIRHATNDGQRRMVAAEVRRASTYSVRARRVDDGALSPAISKELTAAQVAAGKCGLVFLDWYVGLAVPRGGTALPGMSGVTATWSHDGRAEWRVLEASTPGTYELVLRDGAGNEATHEALRWAVTAGMLVGGKIAVLRMRLRFALDDATPEGGA